MAGRIDVLPVKLTNKLKKASTRSSGSNHHFLFVFIKINSPNNNSRFVLNGDRFLFIFLLFVFSILFILSPRKINIKAFG